MAGGIELGVEAEEGAEPGVAKRKHEYLRFGKRSGDMEKRKHEYLRFGKRKHEYLRSRVQASNSGTLRGCVTCRFGKRKHEYLRFGKRKHEYLRFG